MTGPTPPAGTPASSHATPLIVHGNVGYLSGQLPRQNGTLQHLGTVGREVNLDAARAAAQLSAQACLDVLDRELGGGADHQFDRLLKVTGFIASAPGFTSQGAVLDAASDLFRATLGDAGRHTRSAIGVSALPHGACIEIEIIIATIPSEKGPPS